MKTSTEVKKIIRNVGLKQLGKLKEVKIKGNPVKQMFQAVWCKTIMSLYVIDK